MRNLFGIKFEYFFLGMLIFFLSIKGGQTVELIDMWDAVLDLPWIYIAIKNQAQVLAGICSIFVIIGIFVKRVDEKKVNHEEVSYGLYVSFVYLAAIIAFAARGIISYDGAANYKYINGIAFNLIIYLLIYVTIKSVGAQNALINIIDAFLLWGMLYFFANIILFLNGYGYPVDGGRFYGVSGHPNFIGVAMAIVCILFMYYWDCINIYELYVRRIFICFAIVMLFATQSRTGLLMFFSANLSIFIIRRYIKLIHVIGIAVIFLMAYLFLSENVLSIIYSGDDFDERLLENTRKDSYYTLINEWLSNIAFGSGRVTWATENSLLKGLAFGGIFVGLPLFLSYVISIFIFYMFVTRKYFLIHEKAPAVAVSILIALVVGAQLEGFLLEMSGVWVLAFMSFLIVFDEIFVVNGVKL